MRISKQQRWTILCASLLVAAPRSAVAHGLMSDPPSRNAFCGLITKPDGAAPGSACAQAFNAPGVDRNTGYNFMSVLTHTTGYAGVGARTNVCSFNAEPWNGAATPWDQPIDWPTNSIGAGPLNITWNISWGPHFDDTQEFRYWITRPGFVYQVGRPLSFSDFEAQPFCYLTYSDANPSGNPNVVPNKGAATFLTKCNVPARSGRHVIYGEWGRNHFTYERFHGCIDVTFGGGTTTYELGVTRGGTGSGTVTSSPSGINCGASCSSSFVSGTSVTLTATPAAGSTFAGWGGACSGTATTCTVSMTAARSVTANFNTSTSTSYTLSATKAGTGDGTVYSTPAGITCGASCSASFPSGTVVTLVADVAAGSTFAGWGGACTGNATCVVTMSQARSVSATFNTSTGTSYTLSVTRAGTGTGAVSSNPAGISCGSTCSAPFNSGTTVTLSASVASNSTFAGWSGACAGSATTCTVSMTAARSVTATFNTSSGTTYALNVTKSGTGSGTVTSSTGGLDCGAACAATLPSGTTVTLTATAASGSTFAGWSGACSGTAPTCTLSMTAARTANAAFDTSPGGTTPCANPVTFSWNTGNFNGTGAACYRTTQSVKGWGCSNFAGRTVSVNGLATTCGAGPFPLPKHTDGYTYFSATAGQYPWASIYVWE